MQNISQWWPLNPTNKTWLAVGPDASLARRAEFDLAPFAVLALDNTIEQLDRADIAATLDIETLVRSADAIAAKARFLLLPRYPNANGGVSARPLEAYFADIPVLQKLSDDNRLLVCDLSTAPAKAAPDGPVFPAGPNSAETFISVLAELGQKTFRTLGLDFQLKPATAMPALPLERGIGEVIFRHDLDLLPLGADGPIRIFVGTDASQMIGAKVLHYSLQTLTGMTARFDNMQNVTPPVPRDKAHWSRTEFSFRRFAIPAQAGYQGRGVYLDADMQVFQDFRELWDTPFEGATVLSAPSTSPKRKPQYAVMLLDCANLEWDVNRIVAGFDEGLYDYSELMTKLCIVPDAQKQMRLLPQWNSLEEYDAGQTRLIHYTDMPRQPWVSARNANGYLWLDELRRAMTAGFITQSEVDEAIAQGFVRPSLPRQLKTPRALWPHFKHIARLSDRDYKPHATIAKRFAQTA